jgi:polar amino acid transport system substrate-binding protein
MSALPLSRRRWSLACGAWAATPARAGESTPPHPARLQALINPMGRISYLQDERAQGVVPELLRELARRSGVHIDVELLPRARLASLVQAGQGDLSVQARSRALEGLGNFVPFMRMRVMLVCHRAQRAQAPTDLATLIERSDWRGLIVRGAALGETLQGAVARLEAQRRLWLVRDWATVLRMLLARRAEFSLFTPTLLHAELAQMQPGYREQLAALPLADLPSHEVGLMVSQRVPAGLRERLVQQMDALARDGTLRRLMLAEHPAELVAEDFQFFDNPSKRELR